MAGLLEQFSKGLFGLAPTPAPNGVFGQALDSAAQWGRGVQDKGSMLSATLADLLKKPLSMEGRANFLPYQDTMPGSVMNQRQFAAPGILASAFNALTAPARSAQVDYVADEDGNIRPAFNAADEAQNVAMSMMGGGSVASRGAPSGVFGMNVWHGSPHKFDKFDMSKIGTGEGAQAYGHGLYFAENPAVAKQYRDSLSTGELRLKDGGKYDPNNLDHFAAATLKEYPNPESAVKSLTAQAAEKSQINAEWAKAHAQNLLATANRIKRGGLPELTEISHGQVYKVDLPDEHIAKMLDWDKPLSQQAPEVQKALQSSDHPMVKYWVQKSMENPAYNGNDLYLRMAGEKGDKAAAAAELKKLGIPGIRYLDGGSRAGGQGTSNFVIFDDSIPKIIGRE